MDMLRAGLTPAHYFAALKLLEQLHKDGHLPAYLFRNMLREYADTVDLSRFAIQSETEEVA